MRPAGRSEVVGTRLGEVEVCVIDGQRGTVLFFPGGHCPDSVAERVLGPVGFGRRLQRGLWSAISRLVELDSPTHLFWIGPQATQAHQAVQDFMSEHP